MQRKLSVLGHIHVARYLVTALIAIGGCSPPKPPQPPHVPSLPEDEAPARAQQAMLSGRVLRDGVPMTRFAVVFTRSFTSPNPALLQAVHTKDGRFDVDDVPSGTWDVFVVGPGFARTFVMGVRLVDGARTDVGEIHVRRGPTIRGRVTDPAGVVVADARVAAGCRPDDSAELLNDLARGCFRTTTAADGSYSLSDVVSTHVLGQGLWVSARTPSMMSFREVVPEHDAAVDLVIHPYGALRGRVAGELVGFPFVTARWLGAPSRVELLGVYNGEIDKHELPVGDYDVVLHDRGRGSPTRVSVVAGQTTEVTLRAR